MGMSSVKSVGGGIVKKSKVKSQKLKVSNYSSLISIGNLFQAWEEFKKGKRRKYDVQIFERHLEDNLFDLHQRLKSKTYHHGPYSDFYVNDPKRRHIHKAEVFDRIVHHLLYKYLYSLFDKTFIYDSYSCRLNKGTHRAIRRLEEFTRIVSKNYTQDCWSLKLDIKKFFASVDHKILLSLIAKRIKDKNILWLIVLVINSFPQEVQPLLEVRPLNSGKGIPLGNLTSQIFANIYLNELDQFLKHTLKIKHYLRYADDFLIINQEIPPLLYCFETLQQFLKSNLALKLHPNKIILRKLNWGIDFAGYIVLPHYILARTKTKKRILKKFLKEEIGNQSIQSYLGYFSYAKSYKISQELENCFYLRFGSL